MKHDPEQKPEPSVCPRQFCFCWQMAQVFTPGTPAPVTVADGCRCPFGLCTRLDPERGGHDWYEAHEPNLRDAGLPWFYFYPSPEHLTPKMRQRYITESEALWGQEHWRR